MQSVNTYPVALQPNEGRDLQTCWPQFHLSADKDERSFSQFRSDILSASCVPQLLLTFYKSVAAQIPHDAGSNRCDMKAENF